jgi:DNA recombination protein RmuC
MVLPTDFFPIQPWLIALLLFVVILLLMLTLFKLSKSKLLSAHQHAIDSQKQEYLQQLSDLREQKLIIQTRAEDMAQQLNKMETIQRQYADQSALVASLRTELRQQSHAAEDKIKLLEQAREQLSRDFELLSNRIFDEKTESFNKTSKVSLDNALSPLREQLKDFKQKVEDVYDKDSKERVSLLAELGHLKQLNQQISSDAINLTNALKGDNKVQGNWGEVILERVLEESGLHKGREYETQVTLKSEHGSNSRPDVIVRLPENKDIVIDSKVSLVDYERYCRADTEDSRKSALKSHTNSVREHIKGLSFKNYENLSDLRTLDFVFIFIPIESAFMAAFESDQAMFREAYEQNIIVVGPTSLLATLRTIQSIWRYERQNKNAEEIARQAGAMHDKFVGFINDIEDISRHIQRAALSSEDALKKLRSGRGNLVNSAAKLADLGAKTKKSLQIKADIDTDES